MEELVAEYSWDILGLGIVVGITAVHTGISVAIKLVVAGIVGWATVSSEDVSETALAKAGTPVLDICV